MRTWPPKEGVASGIEAWSTSEIQPCDKIQESDCWMKLWLLNLRVRDWGFFFYFISSKALGFGWLLWVTAFSFSLTLIICINFVICYMPVSLALHFGLKSTPFDFDVLGAVEFQVEKVTKTELFQVLQSAVKFKNSSPQKLQTDLFIFADQSKLV